MSETMPPSSGVPVVRQITFADLRFAVSEGIRDFRRAPVFGVAIAALFVIGGVAMYFQLVYWGASWMILPLAVGFPLIGPFAVVGLYEVSHLLGRGEKPNWAGVWAVIFRQRNRQIPSIAFVVLFFLGIWFNLAHLIFALFFGLGTLTNISSSLSFVFTQEGMIMLTIGTTVGGILAFVLFSITAISLPLMVDREVDFVTAMISSFSAVLRNPKVMLSWGLIIAVSTVLAMVPMFLALLVVLPILGHTTWHLYQRVLEPVG